MSEVPTYVLKRAFAARKQLVWLHSNTDADWEVTSTYRSFA